MLGSAAAVASLGSDAGGAPKPTNTIMTLASADGLLMYANVQRRRPSPRQGRRVRIGGVDFLVVGVLAATGDGSGLGLGMSTDDRVFVPLSALQGLDAWHGAPRTLPRLRGADGVRQHS